MDSPSINNQPTELNSRLVVQPFQNQYPIGIYPTAHDEGCFKSFFPYFKWNSMVSLLILVNFAIYFFEFVGFIFTSGSISGLRCVFYYFGALHTPAIVYRYHFHRILFHMFLHANVPHVLGNMTLTFLLGYFIEHKLGAMRFLVFWILSGAFGGTAAANIYRDDVMLGASGACSALFGYYLVYCWINYKNLSDIEKRLIVFFGLAFVPTLFQGAELGVAIWAHGSGLVYGILVGMILITVEEGSDLTSWVLTGTTQLIIKSSLIVLNVLMIILMFTLDVSKEKLYEFDSC